MSAKQQILFDFSSPPEPEIIRDAPVEVVADTITEELPVRKKKGRKPKDPTLVIKKEPGKRGRKSLKEAEAAADLVEIPEDEILFRKQYYTMAEVTRMFQVNHSQIRMWEAQFAILQPKKNKKGDRYFRPVDIKNLYLIHHLIRKRKYTIDGAREYLKNSSKADVKFGLIQSLLKVKEFLLELKANL